MSVKGLSTGVYGWMERWRRDGRELDWNGIFRACTESGLDAVEINAQPERLGQARAYGLAVSATYIGLQLHEPWEALDADVSIRPLAERLAEAGGSDLLINADPADSWSDPLRKTEEHMKRQGDNLSRIEDLVRPLGLKVAMHNHAADAHHAEADLLSVIRYADPRVGLCVDTGWAYVAGCDPLEWVKAYPGRVNAFHLRNQYGKTPSEDLLEGDLDIAAIVKTAVEAGYDGWLSLELWHPDSMNPKRSMTEDTKRSIGYLRELL